MTKNTRQAFGLGAYALIMALCGFMLCASIPHAQATPPAPQAIANVFNTAVANDVNVFAPVTPTANSGGAAYRLTIGLTSTNSVVNLIVDDGVTPTTFALNDGGTLTAGRLYTFVWGVHSDYSYTIQYSTGTTTGYLLIEEIKDGVL